MELGGHSSPVGTVGPLRSWNRIRLAVRSRVGLAPAATLEQPLQERRIKQHPKEKIITVKYEKKTKAVSPGTCDAHPHPTCIVVRVTRQLSQAWERPWDQYGEEWLVVI